MNNGMTAPCAGCPFRRGEGGPVRGLRPSRIEEIVTTEGVFSCHKTMNESRGRQGVCSGWLLFLAEKDNRDHQGQAARMYMGFMTEEFFNKHSQDVFDELDEMVDAHGGCSR